MSAPVRVPVELQRESASQMSGARWFRLARAVAPDGIELTTPVPEELDGPLAVRFHLPGDPQAVTCRGRAVELTVGEGEDERAVLGAIHFLDLDEATRGRITSYVQERLGI
jgi:hypothetical protein